MTLQETIDKIRPIDRKAAALAQKRWDSIGKPLHSLGKMETLVMQIAGITGSASVNIKRGSCANVRR